MKNKEMYDGLLARRSIRSFKSEQVSDEDLQAVLTAGTYAPTAMGAQAPIIVAVQNPDDVKELNALNARMSRDISQQIETRLKELAEQVEIPL